MKPEKLSTLLGIGTFGAGAGVVILLVMLVLGIAVGEGLNVLGQPGTPEVYASALKPAARILTIVMAVDNVFVIAYSTALIAAVGLIWERGRLLGLAGLVFTLLLAGLDLTENALTVQMARMAAQNLDITAAQISALGILEQVKYACGAVAVAVLGVGVGVAVREPKRFVRVVTAAFLLFPAANGAAVVFPEAKLVLFGWMFLVMALAARLFWMLRLLVSELGPGE